MDVAILCQTNLRVIRREFQLKSKQKLFLKIFLLIMSFQEAWKSVSDFFNGEFFQSVSNIIMLSVESLVTLKYFANA